MYWEEAAAIEKELRSKAGNDGTVSVYFLYYVVYFLVFIQFIQLFLVSFYNWSSDDLVRWFSENEWLLTIAFDLNLIELF